MLPQPRLLRHANLRRRRRGQQLQLLPGHRRAGHVLSGGAHDEPECLAQRESVDEANAAAKHIPVDGPVLQPYRIAINVAILVALVAVGWPDPVAVDKPIGVAERRVVC